MNTLRPFLSFCLVLPMLAQAQYTGGQGRGQVMVAHCPQLGGEPGGPCNAGPFYLAGEIDDDCNCVGTTPAPTVDWSLKLKTDHGTETSWENPRPEHQ
ncbi:MAG: hypothetical protein QM724_00420 [Flavobacteriales bacterium]